jgi:hypothetical protein
MFAYNKTSISLSVQFKLSHAEINKTNGNFDLAPRTDIRNTNVIQRGYHSGSTLASSSQGQGINTHCSRWQW